MAGGGGGGSTASSRSLEQTPTWAVALICFSFISVSIFLEHLISSLGNWLRKERKKALSEALEKLKSELMLLGFLSLLLTVAQKPMSSICVPARIADKMLPCMKSNTTKQLSGNAHYMNLLSESSSHSSYGNDNGESNYASHEQKSANGAQALDHCSAKGLVPLITQNAIHQLHIFIFMLAVMHVAYTILTMGFGRAKIRRWQAWEKEIRTTDYQVSNDPRRFRFLRETTFGRRHMSDWSRTTLLLWIKCFFRQFYSSVEKVDYLTLRHGFISTHLPANSFFNFHEYIKRSLDNDFKAVVGISPFLWFLLIMFLLLNVHGLYLYFWLSFVPLVILLAVGAKLQVVVAQMALRLKEERSVIMGTPLVQPTNELFWFGRPKLVLFLIHLTLFQNAFELTFFIWITLQFGVKSCYHEKFEIIIARVVLAVVVQFVCSYVTLPLYALVTQMGSHFKESIFNEQTVSALRRWHMDARDKRKQTPPTAGNSHLCTLSSGSAPTSAQLHHLQMPPNSGIKNQSELPLRSPNGGTSITIAGGSAATSRGHQQA